MLHLKHKYHLDFPHITFPSHQLQLSPVMDDEDELTAAIMSDPETHDNNWVLGDQDSQELEKFWTTVEEDIRHDPEWIRINED